MEALPQAKLNGAVFIRVSLDWFVDNGVMPPCKSSPQRIYPVCAWAERSRV